MFTNAQMAKLVGVCSGLKWMTPEQFQKLKAAISDGPEACIRQLANSDARFVRIAANSVLRDRGLPARPLIDDWAPHIAEFTQQSADTD